MAKFIKVTSISGLTEYNLNVEYIVFYYPLIQSKTTSILLSTGRDLEVSDNISEFEAKLNAVSL